MDLNVTANITGVKELEEAISNVDKKYVEFSAAVNDLRVAARNLGLEINQPPAGTDG